MVWIPLAKEYREKYDEEKAYEFFKTIEGVDYGYRVMLTGWLDTYNQNFPCLPYDPNRCLFPEFIDVLFTFVETIN